MRKCVPYQGHFRNDPHTSAHWRCAQSFSLYLPQWGWTGWEYPTGAFIRSPLMTFHVFASHLQDLSHVYSKLRSVLSRAVFLLLCSALRCHLLRAKQAGTELKLPQAPKANEHSHTFPAGVTAWRSLDIPSPDILIPKTGARDVNGKLEAQAQAEETLTERNRTLAPVDPWRSCPQGDLQRHSLVVKNQTHKWRW